jgi:serine/threonine protein kinase
MYNSNFYKINDIDQEFEKFGSKMKQKMFQRKQRIKEKISNFNVSEDSENGITEKDNKATCTTSPEKSENISTQSTKNLENNTTSKSNKQTENNLTLAESKIPEKNDIIIEPTIITKLADINFIPINQNKPIKLKNEIIDIHKIKLSQKYTLLKQIGNGSYGTIYKAIDEETKKIVAIKRIVNSESGLDCLLEASMMSTIKHPYINSAIEVECNEESLFIVQALADSDLFDYMRPSTQSETGVRRVLSTKLLKKWSWQLCQALYCLHKEKIIHGDIKSSNVLIFGENIKLCDFTLSMKHIPGCTYTIPGSTPSHREISIWLSKNWDESSDIWSLGCTLYEMVYSKLLFPIQEGENAIDIKRKYLNCIYDYGRNTCQDVPYEMYDIEYTKHRPFDRSASSINDLIDKMLRLDSRERPTIREVLNHPYFKGFDKSVNYMSIPNISVINLSTDLKYADDFYSKYTAEPMTIQMAMNIYRSIGKLQNYSTDFILLCSLLMASKMNPNQKYSMPIKPTAKLYECEREICQKLKFHLHNNLDI